MQASAPPVELALSRAGVTGVQKAIRIRRGDAETVMAAEIECTVDLARGQKGVHMSRFPEVFDEAIGDVVLGEARIVEEIAEVIARHIVERQSAVRAEVRITARWPMRRITPVTGLPTQEMVSLIGIAAASEHGTRRVVGVEATGINACPCAQGLVAGRAAERLAEAGFDARRIEQILELVPIATHNQRGRGTLLVGTANDIDAETLVDLVERSMSAPVFELLKRPDELFVVEHAHLQPRFVEDSVRVALKGLIDEVPTLDRRRLRLLTPGQPRDDPRSRRPGGALGHGRRAALARLPGAGARVRRRSPTGSTRRRDAPLLLLACEAGFGAVQEAADVLPVEHDHREARDGREDHRRPRLAEQQAADRQRDGRDERRERRVTEQHEGHEPDDEADARGERRQREHDSAGRRDHLAALAEPEPDRARMAEHRRGAREHADPLTAELDADERGHEALGDVEQRHRHAEPAPVDAPDVRGADVAAPLLADVLVRKSLTTTTPNGIDPIR